MERIFLIIVLGCIGLTAYGQDTGNKTKRVTINLGTAIPIGDLGDKDFRNEDAGYTKSGPLLSAGYSIEFHKNFGLGISLGLRDNQIDKQKILSAYNQKDPATIRYTEFNPRHARRSSFLLADFFVQHPINTITLYTKGSAGIGYSRSPEIIYYSYSPRGSQTIYTRPHLQGEANAFAPIYGIAGGLRYDVGNFGVGIEIGVLATKPDFEIIIWGESEMQKQQMNSFNTSISLSYRGVSGKVSKTSTTKETQISSESNKRVSFNLGAAIPVGDYSYQDDFVSNPGFAKTGLLSSLSFATDVHPNIGLGATLGWRRNGVAMDDFAAHLAWFARHSAGMSDYKGGAWNSVLFLGDLYLQVPLDNLTFYTKGSVGTSTNRSPSLTITFVSSDAGSVDWKQIPSYSQALAFGFGGGIRYDIGRIGANLEIGTLKISPEFDLLMDVRAGLAIQPMHTVNTTLGVYYRL